MITGLNTTVEFEGKEYHVQTEDRGRDHPILESNIYLGGAILGAKKTSYKQFLKSSEYSEKRLRQMLEAQHYSIVRAIRSGRVAARRRARIQAKVRPLPPAEPGNPHVELFSSVLEETGESPFNLQVRIVETFNGKPIARAEVSVEIFGSGMVSRQMTGVTDDEGFLNLKIDIPQQMRVAAAMLFRVDRARPTQELKVLVVKTPQR